jgi:hypothetical protein
VRYYPIVQIVMLPLLSVPLFVWQLFVPLICVLVCVFVFVWVLSAYATDTVAGSAKAPTINANAANAAIATLAFVFIMQTASYVKTKT